MIRRIIIAIIILLVSQSEASDYLDKNFDVVNADLSGTTWYVQRRSIQRAWYIQAVDTSNADKYRITFHYTSGDTDYVTGWTNRATLTYGDIADAF